MSCWLRALVLAVLLPAYCLAAIGVHESVFAPVVADAALAAEGLHASESRDGGVTAGLAVTGVDLVFELGDTSDDAAELLTTAVAAALIAPVPSGIVVAPNAGPPANAPDRLLRPPRAARPA